LIVTILGSGCTYGTPKPGCGCRTCREAAKKGVQRTRFGLLVQGKKGTLLVDAGPDLRQQMLDNHFSMRDFDAVYLTHAHYDHFSGVGEFRGLKKAGKLQVYGGSHCIRLAKEQFGHLRREFVDFKTVKPYEPLRAAGFEITPVRLNHNYPCTGLAIREGEKKVCVASDTRLPLPARTMAEFEGADLLVVDGFAETSGDVRKFSFDVWGKIEDKATFDAHFSVKGLHHLFFRQAEALARGLRAKKAVSVHTIHSAPPHCELAKRHETKKFLVGFDGRKIRV